MLSGTVCSLHSIGVQSQDYRAVASSSKFCRRPALFTKLSAPGSRHTSSGKQSRQHTVHVCAIQSRPLSFNQRWRIFKTTTQEETDKAKAAFRALPPVQAWSSFLRIVREKADPLFWVLYQIQWYKYVWDASYASFSSQEVKRQWEWKRRSQKEWDLWISVFRFLYACLLTALWMGITPVSIFWGAFLPGVLTWIMYDNQLKSPIFVTFVPLLLFKFPLGHPVRLF